MACPKSQSGKQVSNMSTSDIQERWQAYGPHRPTVKEFIHLLGYLPSHVEIQAIAIRGQGGGVVIETRHDDANMIYAFEEDESGKLTPSSAERLTPK